MVVTPFLERSRGEVGEEPVSSELGCRLEGAGFFEQMRGAWHDGELVFAAKSGSGVFVETQHGPVVTTDDEQRGGPHTGEW